MQVARFIQNESDAFTWMDGMVFEKTCFRAAFVCVCQLTYPSRLALRMPASIHFISKIQTKNSVHTERNLDRVYQTYNPNLPPPSKFKHLCTLLRNNNLSIPTYHLYQTP